MDIDLYKYFNLTESCDVKDIKRAYKDKARQLHPDKNTSNPLAKEEFQKLKEYYELLHEPDTRKEYDRKWKAKRESIRRHEALDEQRRKLKEKLEVQEAKARSDREKMRKHVATNAVADQLRQDWQQQTDKVQFQVHMDRKRAKQEHETEHGNVKHPRESKETVVKVKWNWSENREAAACYTKDFVRITLSEFGDVTTLMMGKRGTAVAEFPSHLDAMAAVEASEKGLVGFPTVPLQLSIIREPSAGTDHDCSADLESEASTLNHSGFSGLETSGRASFDSFESDILSRMANFKN